MTKYENSKKITSELYGRLHKENHDKMLLLWEFTFLVKIGLFLAIMVGLGYILVHEVLQPYFGKNVIKIKYHTDIEKVKKISVGDWVDLRSAETVELKAGEFKLISLGVSMKLPDGFEAHVVPRSSTFKTWGILQTNSMSVIDNSYSGNADVWRFPAYATKDCIINKGDRICQFRIMKRASMQFQEVEDLGDVSRGGFGSTGSK